MISLMAAVLALLTILICRGKESHQDLISLKKKKIGRYRHHHHHKNRGDNIMLYRKKQIDNDDADKYHD